MAGMLCSMLKGVNLALNTAEVPPSSVGPTGMMASRATLAGQRQQVFRCAAVCCGLASTALTTFASVLPAPDADGASMVPGAATENVPGLAAAAACGPCPAAAAVQASSSTCNPVDMLPFVVLLGRNILQLSRLMRHWQLPAHSAVVEAGTASSARSPREGLGHSDGLELEAAAAAAAAAISKGSAASGDAAMRPDTTSPAAAADPAAAAGCGGHKVLEQGILPS